MKKYTKIFMAVVALMVTFTGCIKTKYCEYGEEGIFYYLKTPIELNQGRAVAIFCTEEQWYQYFDEFTDPEQYLSQDSYSWVPQFIDGKVPAKFRKHEPQKVRLIFHPTFHLCFGTYAESLDCIESIE